MREVAEEWQAVGFRSPSLLRDFELIRRSVSSTTRRTRTPIPCRLKRRLLQLAAVSYENVVELPITLAQDHNLFELLGQRDESLWTGEGGLVLRSRGGMASILTHPDYMLERDRLDAYERLLCEFVDDRRHGRRCLVR